MGHECTWLSDTDFYGSLILNLELVCQIAEFRIQLNGGRQSVVISCKFDILQNYPQIWNLPPRQTIWCINLHAQFIFCSNEFWRKLFKKLHFCTQNINGHITTFLIFSFTQFTNNSLVSNWIHFENLCRIQTVSVLRFSIFWMS